jgi:hypothetical protein
MQRGHRGRVACCCGIAVAARAWCPAVAGALACVVWARGCRGGHAARADSEQQCDACEQCDACVEGVLWSLTVVRSEEGTGGICGPSPLWWCVHWQATASSALCQPLCCIWGQSSLQGVCEAALEQLDHDQSRLSCSVRGYPALVAASNAYLLCCKQACLLCIRCSSAHVVGS